MFGYITINKPELKIKDFDQYNAYYCGLCHCLKSKYGKPGQLTLSYDMTFLSVLLTSLYEPESDTQYHRCVTHPIGKHRMLLNLYSTYAADMNIFLSYYNLMDDWKDDHNFRSYSLAKILHSKCTKIAENYPRQYHAVKTYLKKLSAYEEEDSADIDAASGLTGEMLGELFVFKEDEWAATLRRMGFFLGKFIYLMDAYEDLKEDIKNNQYNPWKSMADRDDFHSFSQSILTMMMSECSFAFEQLPILMNADILRNILYSGVWSKYDQIKENQNHV